MLKEYWVQTTSATSYLLIDAIFILRQNQNRKILFKIKRIILSNIFSINKSNIIVSAKKLKLHFLKPLLLEF
jgi:hypothetical protein